MAKLYVFYHFFNPDPVISSVLFSDLASGLADLGWEVTAFPSNRDSGSAEKTYPPVERWRGIWIRRIWRPRWKQASSAGRVLNAVWILARWMMLALCDKDVPDVIVVGTDPIFSVLIAPVWRYLHPDIKIVHWCFDLYPEAAYADGLLTDGGMLSRVLEGAMKRGYLACDLVVDIGMCMRRLLHGYDPGMRSATLLPWALSEPVAALAAMPESRIAMFGDAQIALMYSGGFGRAHAYEDMLDLMRHLRRCPAKLVLSIKGNCEQDLRAAITTADTNIAFVPFVHTSSLEQRLASADIHIVSLREEWTGTVVPSKFFGALAVGRPVLFCGSRHSSLAEWIEKFNIGWVLEAGQAGTVAESLRLLLDDPGALEEMKKRCHQVYQDHFSRTKTIEEWNRNLEAILAGK